VTASAMRMRRRRDRQRRGIVACVMITVPKDAVSLFIANRLLSDAEASDRGALQRAAARALEQWAAGRGAQI
jgi:hypothetical protein